VRTAVVVPTNGTRACLNKCSPGCESLMAAKHPRLVSIYAQGTKRPRNLQHAAGSAGQFPQRGRWTSVGIRLELMGLEPATFRRCERQLRDLT
jgi:hypothetical protein